MRQILFGFLLIVCSLIMNGGNYTVKKGQTLTLKCTAQAPVNGWITHAFFNLVNPEDAQYVGINYNSSDCYATIYGLKVAYKIAIEVTYAYSFRGTYDNTIHVGHGTYTDYVTVDGPRKATSFKFREGNDIIVPAGGSVVVHVDFSPTGSVPDDFSFGFINTFGQPYDFSAKTVGSSYDIQITGRNKPGSYVYLAAFIDNDNTTVQTAKLTIRDDVTAVVPTSLILEPETLTLTVGKSESLLVKYQPDNAWVNPSFVSKDTDIATVDEYGKITAKSPGTTLVTVEAGTLKKSCHITVLPKPTGFDMEQAIVLTAGFSYNVQPTPIPKEAKATFKLTSSDTNIFTVSGQMIKGIRSGEAKLIVKCPESNTEKEITVVVNSPDKGFDIRQATQRVQVIKKLFYKSL